MKPIQFIICGLLFSTVFVSCSKDDEELLTPTLITAQLFENTSVMENSTTLDFKINFDKPASANGFIIVKATSTGEGAFQTFPAVDDGEIEVPVIKGSDFSIIRFSPEDNQTLNENEIVTLELLESSQGIIFGSKRTTTIEIFDNESAVSASFNSSGVGTLENNAEGVEVRINLSAAAPGEGSLHLELLGDNDAYYIDTNPALDAERKLTLPVVSGTLFTTFRVYAKDNELVGNHKTLKFRIVDAGGVVVKGALTEIDVVVMDDEIMGRIKSSETVKDGKRTKKTWEYAPNGKVSKLIVEDQTPQEFIYYYDEEGKIQHIAGFTGDGETFIWTNGKITLSEKIRGFFKVGYSTYEYNGDGRIEKKTDFTIKANGEYTAETYHVYEYYAEGNMKKRSTYTRGNQSNWVLNSSLAFSQYSDKMNPDPIEIIPTFSIQQHLPNIFYITGDGINFSHYYAYQYNGNGLLTTKITTGETTTFEYY